MKESNNPTPTLFSGHPGFTRVFAQGRLTVGFILPLEGYANSACPTLHDHARLTRLADELGFAALWARDVPLYDPEFGDAGQILDPFSYLGFLASNTRSIALATGSAVITLRHPLHLGKQAASVDHLSNGRMLLGVASGDRPIEYPAFNLENEFERRDERFREAFGLLRLVAERNFPIGHFPRFGDLYGNADLLPKPALRRIPTFVTGRSRQDIDWIAKHSDGWFYYFVDLDRMPTLTGLWREAVMRSCAEPTFKPFAQGLFFDLDHDPDFAPHRIHSGLRIGRNALVDYLNQLQQLGVHHVAFNLKASRRPAEEVLHELAEHVLPCFPSHLV
jgi:luciferase-type oxidoreductase